MAEPMPAETPQRLPSALFASTKRWFSALGCRLCWRITGAVFISILVVETIVLIPSAQRFESQADISLGREAVGALAAFAMARREPGAKWSAPENLDIFISHAPDLFKGVRVMAPLEKSVAVGEPIESFSLRRSSGDSIDPRTYWKSAAGDRLELSAPIRTATDAVDVDLRLDASRIRREVIAFKWRIAGLVTLIVLVVTVATMLVLHVLLLSPLMRLRNSMYLAANSPAIAGRFSVRSRRRDEFGDMLIEHNRLLSRVEAYTGELTRLNDDLDSFAHMVAHDLAAPLRAIDGFAEILAGHAADMLDSEGKRHLGRIRDAASRMNDILANLRRLARVSREPLEVTEFDLTVMVSECIDALCAGNPNRKVELRMPEHLKIRADLGLLRVALTNLLGNALKYSLRREQAIVTVGVNHDGSERQYFIRDNGVGFDMKDSERLFKPFQRLHAGADFAGTGIGLVIVRRVVERHAGRIWAQAALGYGATFYFTLPLAADSGDSGATLNLASEATGRF